MSSSSGSVVLVVDDEEDLAQALKLFLQHLGLTPIVCHRIREARAVVMRHPHVFPLAFIDQQVAGDSGSEFAVWLLQHSPATRIALMSGLPLEPEDLPTCIQGKVIFLQKPFRPADVALSIERMRQS